MDKSSNTSLITHKRRVREDDECFTEEGGVEAFFLTEGGPILMMMNFCIG